ncbi:MAG: hypothetical protein U5R46_12030 [Gammaproteobacteria bacterium]|nr:hypothetical protein [Gammaproteobacteria bacterium]
MTYKYPFSGSLISLKQAKALIADVVYEGEDRAKVLKRIGGRINYAIKRERLSVKPSGGAAEKVFDVDEFFRWAQEVPGWRALRDVKGVPFKPKSWSVTAVIEADLTPQAPNPTVTPAKVSSSHSGAMEQHDRDQVRIEELETRNAALEQENAKWRAADAEKRKKASAAGKKQKFWSK